MPTFHALSLKQPWAALLAHGKKTIEVRRWRTDYRGLVLIHAARVPDERREAWEHLPPDLLDAARLGGGLVGAGALYDVKKYKGREPFVADQERHLNDPSWFEPAGLYGFCFRELRPLPFRRVPGYVRLFELTLDDLEVPPPPAEEPTAPPEGAPPAPSVWQRFQRLVRSLGGSRPRTE